MKPGQIEKITFAKNLKLKELKSSPPEESKNINLIDVTGKTTQLQPVETNPKKSGWDKFWDVLKGIFQNPSCKAACKKVLEKEKEIITEGFNKLGDKWNFGKDIVNDIGSVVSEQVTDFQKNLVGVEGHPPEESASKNINL